MGLDNTHCGQVMLQGVCVAVTSGVGTGVLCCQVASLLCSWPPVAGCALSRLDGHHAERLCWTAGSVAGALMAQAYTLPHMEHQPCVGMQPLKD